MSGAPTPPVLPEAFAAQADPGYINTIPDTSVDPQRASYAQGFPPQTMTPIGAGGKPMLGPDMNGVLFALSSHTFYQQTGQPYVYDAGVAASISGYAVGTVLGRADGTGLWLNIVDGNSTDPDASGEGWIPIASYGYESITSTGGQRFLTNLEASRNVIVVGGALVANLQVIFPAQLRSWLVVNTTSGAFSVTVRPINGGGGVVVPQGGFAAPVEVYGDGTNLYPTVAPLTIPTSVAADPNTYVLRSNTADVFARYFNSGAAVDNAAVTNVITDSGDGYLRKNTLSNFEAQLLLQMIGGAVTAGQVPVGAVTQYTPNILASAALTGVPTAPTPAAGDSSTKVATTAFVAGSLTVVGTTITVSLPGGLILKAGFTQGAAGLGDVVVTFSAAFPNACIAAVCCTANRNGAGSSGTGYVRSLTAAGFIMLVDAQQVGGGTGFRGGYWIAIGR